MKVSFFYKVFVASVLLLSNRSYPATWQECQDGIEASGKLAPVINSISTFQKTGAYGLYYVSLGCLYEYQMGEFENILISTTTPMKRNRANIFITIQSNEHQFLQFLNRQVDLSLNSHLYCSSDSGYGLTFCCIYEGERRNRAMIYEAVSTPCLFGKEIK